ncbi:MAG: molybdopterin biosynthesis protein MoeB, partial [Rhodanobacter sp.]
MSPLPDSESWLAELRGRISEVAPTAALAQQSQGALLIDVREDGERAAGSPAGALGLSRGFLELRIEQAEADRERPIIALCGSGTRSLLAAETL